MTELNTKPDHQTPIGFDNKNNEIIASPAFQNFLDDLEIKLNTRLLGQSVILEAYTVATLPDASKMLNGVVIVSDESGGRTLATSDATNWRRVSDGNIVS